MVAHIRLSHAVCLAGLLWCLAPWQALGQPVAAEAFSHAASLPSVASDGFYRILLPPRINGHMNANFSDVRLYGPSGKPVPYFMERDVAERQETTFHPYAIVSRENVTDSREDWGPCTAIMLHNPKRNQIDNLVLQVRQSAVQKRVELSGSHDGKEWFAIRDDFRLLATTTKQQPSSWKTLRFPVSNFAYYRLKLSNKESLPIEVLRAGYYENSSNNGDYELVPAPQLQHSDSLDGRFTAVHVTYPLVPHADQVRLTVRGAAYFHRPVRLYAVETASDQSTIYRSIASWTVRSDAPNDYPVRGMHGQEYLLVIDNGDNPPLEVTSLEASQLNRYLVAHLHAGKAYRLGFGNPDAPVPHYDLGHFRKAVADSIPQLLPGPVERVVQTPDAPDDTATAWPPWVLWTGIGLVMAILAYFSLNMLRHVSGDAPKEPEHDA